MAQLKVTSREGRVSRNGYDAKGKDSFVVTSREGRVSRNKHKRPFLKQIQVTSREGRVSRNRISNAEKCKEPSESRPARDV